MTVTSDDAAILRNALKWISHLSALHYLGAAFDPEHMLDISRLARDALSGVSTLPDFDESMANARDAAAAMAHLFPADESSS